MSRANVNPEALGVRHVAAAPTLELKDVSVAFVGGADRGITLRGPASNGNGYALQDISFRVNRGLQVAVVGPNGAGKSTLLKLIAGIIKPTRGAVSVFGHGTTGHTCVAYLPQHGEIDWSFPACAYDVVMMGRAAQIGLFRRPGKRDREIVMKSLERVNAVGLSDKQIGELSGGQRQRVFVARALAQEAELLLMDEPFTGLDGPSRAALLEILDSLKLAGVTLFLATHDLKLAAERFDWLILLDRRIVAAGPPAKVLEANNLQQVYDIQVGPVPGASPKPVEQS